jgi:hypothetical protein
MSFETLLGAGLKRELEQVRPTPGAWSELRSRLEEAQVGLWHRVWQRGVSRRQFLRGAAVAAGGVLMPLPAAGAAAAGLAPQPSGWGTSLPFRPASEPRLLFPTISTFSPTGTGPDVYLRGLGFCADPNGVAAAAPASATMGEFTLSVERLATVGDRTWVELELADAGEPAMDLPPQSLVQGKIILRDTAGRLVGEGPLRMQTVRVHRDGGAAAWTRLHLPDVRLRAGEVEVAAAGPRLPEGLSVRLRLMPVAEVGLPAVRLTGASATARGVTISVVSAAHGGHPTVLRLAAAGVPGGTCIGSRIMWTRSPGDELVLRDSDGREYLETLEDGSRHPISHDEALFDDVAYFPRLPPHARGLELVVSSVTVREAEGEAVVDVALAGLRAGVRQPLVQDLRLGRYPVRVTGVELTETETRQTLALHLDLGEKIDGRLLLRPARVTVDGQVLGHTIRWSPHEVLRSEVIEVPLPPHVGEAVRVTLSQPTVEISGPWVVPLKSLDGR